MKVHIRLSRTTLVLALAALALAGAGLLHAVSDVRALAWTSNAPLTVWSVLCCAVSLLATLVRARRLALVLLGFAALGTAVALAGVFWWNGLDIDPVATWMRQHWPDVRSAAPNLDLALVMVEVSLLLLILRVPHRGFLILGICLVQLVLTLVPLVGWAAGVPALQGWRYFPAAEPVSAVSIALLGLALIARAWRSIRRHRAEWIYFFAVLFSAVVVAAALNLWQALIANQVDRGREVARTAAVEITRTLELNLDDRLNAVRRLARHVQGLPDAQRGPHLSAEAEEYFHDYPGLVAIGVIGPDGHFSALSTRSRAMAEVGEPFDIRGVRRRLLAQAQRGNEIVVSRSMALRTGNLGFLTLMPLDVGRPGAPPVLVVGVDYRRLLGHVLAVLDRDVVIRIADADVEVYSRPAEVDEPTHQLWTVNMPIRVAGIDWRLQLWPSATARRAAHSLLPDLVLTLGVLAGLLISAAIVLVHLARQRAGQLERVSDQLTRAQEIAELGNWSLQADTGEFHWSAQLYRIFGVDPKDFVPTLESFLDCLAPSDRQVWEAAPGRLPLDSKGRLELVSRLAREEGVTRHIYIRGEVVQTHDGEPLRLEGTMQDITLRALANRALRESEERFRLVTEQTGQLIYDYDLLSGDIVLVGATDLLFDPPRQHTSIEEWRQRLHPDHVDRVVAALEHSIEEGGPFREVYRIRHDDGRWIYVEAAGAFLSVDEATPRPRMVGTLNDVTDRVRADIERGEYALRQRQLANLANDMLRLHDSEALLQHVAEMARDILGARYALTTEPGAADNEQLLRGAASDGVGVRWAESDATGLYRDVEALGLPVRMGPDELEKHPDWVRFGGADAPSPARRGVLIAPLISADQHVYGMLELADKLNGEFTENDERIAEQLAAMTSVALDNARLYRELELRVQRRTAELESAYRELESFSYSVSHDLRAPLRAISGFTEILRDNWVETLPEEARMYFQRVQAAADRMAILIDSLLKLSRISRQEMRCRPVDLSQLVADVAEEIASEESVPAEVVVQSDMQASGDAKLLTVALRNLLGNAWKFSSRQPRPRIEVGCETPENERRTVYYVRDNGIGFDMQYGEKLFGVFQRLHAADEFPGTGIGLATVRRVIEKHGGKIWAESRPGEGATFYFTLRGSSK